MVQTKCLSFKEIQFLHWRAKGGGTVVGFTLMIKNANHESPKKVMQMVEHNANIYANYQMQIFMCH